jgi:hypothetical protein
MAVYQNTETQATAKVLPTARDASGAAVMDQPTAQQGIGRVVTHELGHGLQEVAHDPAAVGRAAGPLLMERYARAIGWRQVGSGGAREWRLYDVGDPAVERALAGGGTPEEQYRITRDTWQRGWHEQPISRYQVREGPFEDFPEAVMAYIANPTVLQQRSPHRYDFVRSTITELAGRLGTPATGGGSARAAASP